MEDFATISQLQNECTRLQNGAMATKIGDFTLWGFRSHFAAAKWGYCAAKWHSCAKRWFRSCENFRRGGVWGCEIISQQSGDFAAKWRFRNELVGAAKWFHSKGPISQRLLLGCEILQTPVFPLFLHFFLLQTTFLQFLCNSS